MSGYEPRDGDTVEVTLRGTVYAPVGVGFYLKDDVTTWVSATHVVSVEKVEPPKPPLPTTPGHVIVDDDGMAWTRIDPGDDDWTWQSFDDKTDDRYFANQSPTVIWPKPDAGAES